jgi:hypothetical protein
MYIQPTYNQLWTTQLLFPSLSCSILRHERGVGEILLPLYYTTFFFLIKIVFDRAIFFWLSEILFVFQIHPTPPLSRREYPLSLSSLDKGRWLDLSSRWDLFYDTGGFFFQAIKKPYRRVVLRDGRESLSNHRTSAGHGFDCFFEL